jgi:hypothetical protein
MNEWFDTFWLLISFLGVFVLVFIAVQVFEPERKPKKQDFLDSGQKKRLRNLSKVRCPPFGSRGDVPERRPTH